MFYPECCNLFLCIDENLSGPPVTSFINLGKVFTIFVTGITYDVRMIRLLQKRENEVAPQIPGQDQLVPWKSGPKEEKEVLTIPLRATIVNTIGIVFSKLSILLNSSTNFDIVMTFLYMLKFVLLARAF